MINIMRDHFRKKTVALFSLFLSAVFVAAILSVKRRVPLMPLLFSLFLFAVSAASLYYGLTYVRNFAPERGKLWLQILVIAASAVPSAVGFTYMYHVAILQRTELSSLCAPDGLVRVYLLFWPLIILNCYTAFDCNKTSDFIFKYRWPIAMLFAAILILAQVSFSSISYFSYTIQPESVQSFTMPVFGKPRGIRSDEWLAISPRKMSAEFGDYGEFNYIIRGTRNYNIAGSELYFSYSALANLLNIGYFLFGSEYGISFYHVMAMVLCYMISFEFSYIISKRNRAIALLGASMIALSQYNLWWWGVWLNIFAMQAVIVCATYFFESKKRIHKVCFAILVALSGCYFICALYPAWQVPLAYVALTLLVWVIVTHMDAVKSMKRFDWLIIAGAFAFMCSVVVAYLYDSRIYIAEVMDTAYPGSRFDTGGYAIDKAMTYPASLMYPFKDTNNNSEAGTYFNLFPLPFIWACGSLIKNVILKIRKKEYEFDLLCSLLLIPATFFSIYCTIGFPESLAKYSLMSFSFGRRTMDILGLINAYLLLRILAEEKENKVPVWLGFIISFVALLLSLNAAENAYPNYMPGTYVAFITVFVLLFGVVAFCRVEKRRKKKAILAISAVLSICGLCVLPVTRGINVITDKPASYAIREIVEQDPDGKWIACGGSYPPQFLIANGAPTINSLNYVPNMELWSKLDPTGKYNEVYNRYCHIDCSITEEETWFELRYPDAISLHLSCDDFSTADVRYVFSLYPVEETSEQIDFELLYQEENVFIYKVIYL